MENWILSIMDIQLFNKHINLIFPLLIILNMACGKKPSSPTSFNIEDYPAAPNNIRAAIGDGVIVLTWLHPNLETIQNYTIYRQDSTEQTFRNIGSTELQTYTDSNLQNNREFSYKISAVGKNGLEGEKSRIVSAVPAIYGVTINSGQEFTNSRSVTLSFTAPATTSFIKVSNDSLLADAQWESFVALRSWTLTLNDGEKIVYVKFKDAEDRETIKPYFDTITLDTEAMIENVTEDTEGQVKSNGDTIHFTVVTGEPGGRAWIELVGKGSAINLVDNGTHGDATNEDGIYEVDFIIPNGLELEKSHVVGNFTDRVGNAAQKVTASGVVTIRRSPTRVDLIQVAPVNPSSTTLTLFWTTNSNNDFASYRIFRSITSGVNTESSLVTILQDQSTVSYTDSDLEPNTTYFYRVYVFDTTGLFSGSNEVSGTTNPNEPPKPVSLSIPVQTDSLTLQLSWSQSDEEDFASYRLYRSEFSPVDTTNALFILNDNRTLTQYDDASVKRGVEYFYRVFVFDKWGLSAGSNEVSGRISN